MDGDVKIKYINKSMNQDLAKVFLFMKDADPTFDCLKDGIAWKVISDVGRESSCLFTVPALTGAGGTWNSGSCRTTQVAAVGGGKYYVVEDNTGIVTKANGNEGDKRIHIFNQVNVKNGIGAVLYKGDNIALSISLPEYGYEASMVLIPKLYWGLAQQIDEGAPLSTAILYSDKFFEQDLEGVSNATVALYGNDKDDYEFKIENQS